MVDVDKAIIARIKKGGLIFEILVDTDKALAYREGKGKLEDALATDDHIYTDVKQAERASEHDLQKIFGTVDPYKIASIIIKEGEIQLTAKHRETLREEKKKQIIQMIHRNAVDAKTGLPHPPQRIERAMQEAKVRIDEFKKAEEQIQDIARHLQTILPIKFEIRELAVRINSKHAGQGVMLLKKYGKLLKSEWTTDGSLTAVIEIPAGIQEDFYDELNKLTHGEAETKILNRR
ncbi:ribosome assembly factor SBDS [Candidatus Woesearchaeota archaeon]|nr:ribosome assembly factor SBDS [Candidatus Woesearchaeota archaeon]